MPFKLVSTKIEDLKIISPMRFGDDRGFFQETYKKSDFEKFGIDADFIQDNHSVSKKGTVRGLHYQLNPMEQGKLVRVIGGKVWDVAVDIRKSSPTFLKWVGVELSDENGLMFYIPPGFAHGFVALTDNVHLLYKCTNEYSKENEAGIKWNDPKLNIKWPIESALVSEKDEILPYLDAAILFN